MASYMFECADCEIGVRVSRPIDDRDVPPTEEEYAICGCPEGKSPNWRRVYEAAGIMVNSYLDGQSRGDTYNKLKEAAKLEADSMNLPPAKRTEHNKAIKELKKL